MLYSVARPESCKYLMVSALHCYSRCEVRELRQQISPTMKQCGKRSSPPKTRRARPRKGRGFNVSSSRDLHGLDRNPSCLIVAADLLY